MSAIRRTTDTQAVQEKKPPRLSRKNNGAVAYIEGGGYTDYQRILAATAKGLAELGVIADGDVPLPGEDWTTPGPFGTGSTETCGARIGRGVLKDAYYSANWDDGATCRQQKGPARPYP